MSTSRPRPLALAPLFALALLALIPLALASSGDRNPTFQHCLKGCQLTYCEPHQPPLPGYLRAFGWTCKENCAYECGHSFTDHIRPGSKHLQFYGKWAFYRLGPFQEPISILMSLGNLYVNLQGLGAVRRRIRAENGMRTWLVGLALVQVNTWVWSSVFHARDTPTTERLDYFSATLTISFTLLYTLLRVFHLQTPLATSRLVLPVSAGIAFVVLGHFTYLLSFPVGAFPYGYHTQFNLVLAGVHNVLWILWSLSFKYRLPNLRLGSVTLGFPKPYPPNDPSTSPRPNDAMTPLILVLLTTGAMAFELLDFAPVFRLVDAHSLWHAATIPLTIAWWHFLAEDAITLEGSLLNARTGTGSGAEPGSQSGTGSSMLSVGDEKGVVEGEGRRSLSGGGGGLRTPTFTQLAAMPKGTFPRPRSPGKVDKPE